MKTKVYTGCLTLVLTLGLVDLSAAQEEIIPRIMEALPQHIEVFVREDTLPQPDLEFIPHFVLNGLKFWAPGQALQVAFIGGTPELHRHIVEVASEWTQYGNIHLDFGYSELENTYRTVAPNDDSDIRISFGYRGYWSTVGRDSKRVPPGIATMNFARFDVHPPAEPRFTEIVLHEFGHAFGLEHEHQHPYGECDDEFDWDKLYQYLGGEPNNWSKEKVRHNLGQLLPSPGLIVSNPDRESIMYYAFDSWMFKNGVDSPCYVEENTQLSELDKLGINVAYPAAADRAIALQMNALIEVLGEAALTALPRLALQDKLHSLQAVIETQDPHSLEQ